MENAAGARGSLPGADCVASLSLADSAGLSLPRSPARKLFKTALMSSDAAETGGFAVGVGGEMNVMLTWPGPAFTPEALSWLVPALKEPPPPPLPLF